MQLVVGQQLQRALEVLGQRLHREIRAGMLARADRIERLLECHPVEVLAAVGQQPLEDLRHAFLVPGLLGLGTIADMPEHTHRVAHVLALHDECQPVGQRADDRVQSRCRHLEALQCLDRPRRQRRRMCFTERDRLLSAEAAAGGHRRA